MFKKIAVCVLALMLATPVFAQRPDTTTVRAAYEFEKITVSTTAVGFTASKIAPTSAGRATLVVCSVETNPIRVRMDGTNPDASTGVAYVAGSTITLNGYQDISRFKAIRSGGADGTLNCQISR